MTVRVFAMNPIRPHRLDDAGRPFAAEPGSVADVSDAVARLRAEASSASAGESSDLSNVVPFPRLRDGANIRAAALPVVTAADRPAIAFAAQRHAARWMVFLACSVAAHLLFYLPFRQEPEEMVSLGELAVSVDIILGANEQAGAAQQSDKAEAPVASEAKPTEQPAEEPNPEVARVEPPKESEPQQRQLEQVKPESKSLSEPPKQAATLPNMETMERVPEPAHPTPPQRRGPVNEPVAQPRPPEPKRVQMPDRREHKSQERQAKLTAPTPPSSSVDARASRGVGQGRSVASSHYAALVAAHLARHKQFPSDARSRGDQGSAAVSFGIDGSGRVTSVSLVRGTGIASLDREATAMVRRASPFPAPPTGQGMRFTVPVSFRLQ